MQVNGEKIDMQGSVSLSEFLGARGYDAQRVAVEKNGAVVPREKFDTEMLSDGDRLEIVHFVGGG